jgi:hypothetical protein
VNEIKNTHKDKIEMLRKKYQHNSSSHAFTSLYLWQQSMGLSVICEEGFFAVKNALCGENSYFFPCGSDESVVDFLKSKITEKSFSLCYLRSCDVKWLDEKFPGVWEFKRTEESDEYICDISEYINLSGSKFSEIRRKIRKLEKEHNIIAKPIAENTIQDAMSVVADWYNGEHSEGKQHLTDDHIADVALSERDILGISGIVLYSDDVPVAVFAGFPLSDDTVDVLIGKTSTDAPKGIVYYGLREYLKTCADRYTYCNHEEDLGIPGIRMVKESLCPIYKIQMWEAILK